MGIRSLSLVLVAIRCAAWDDSVRLITTTASARRVQVSRRATLTRILAVPTDDLEQFEYHAQHTRLEPCFQDVFDAVCNHRGAKSGSWSTLTFSEVSSLRNPFALELFVARLNEAVRLYEDSLLSSVQITADRGPDGGDIGLRVESIGTQSLGALRAPVPSDALTVSQAWSGSILSDLKICPFAYSDGSAGLPRSPVRYAISDAAAGEALFADFFAELALIAATPADIFSTTLLVAPHAEDLPWFKVLSEVLDRTLVDLHLDSELQLVFFHPQWELDVDGASGRGLSVAANYARRSPYPMINILRTSMVQKGQRKVRSDVYIRNREVLDSIGVPTLERCLRDRAWESAIAAACIKDHLLD